MKRRDVLIKLRRRKDYLTKRIGELKDSGRQYSYETDEFWALDYAIIQIEDSPPEPDERCRKLMSSYRVTVATSVEPKQSYRAQLVSDAEHLQKFAKSGFAGPQFRAGVISEFIRGLLTKLDA